MLSKKMAVSLTSLIIILALAFAAPSVMAGDFNVSVMGTTSVTYAPGATLTDPLSPVRFTVTGDQALADFISGGNVVVPLTVDAYNKEGFEITKDTTTMLPTGVALIELPKAPVSVGDPFFPERTAKKRQYQVTITPGAAPNTIGQVVFTIAAFETPDARVGADDDMSKEVKHTINVSEAPAVDAPMVVSIQRLRPGSQTVVAAFEESILQPEPFDIRIVFTEKWNVDLAKVGDILAVTNGTAKDVVAGVPFARVGGTNANQTTRPHPTEGMYEHTAAAEDGLAGVPAGVNGSGSVPMPTGDDSMYHQYRATITPHMKSADFDIKISVKGFDDGGSPVREFYVPVDVGAKPNGREELRLRVKGAERNLTAGYKVTIPKDWIIPANGYLIVAAHKLNSRIDTSGQDADRTNDTPRATHRTPAQLKYNVIEMASLPNLATQFINGVVVDVESQHAGLVISEVMWGEDESLIDRTGSQWIELYNPGGQYKTIDDKDETPDINEALTLIFYAPNEFDDVPEKGADGSLPTGITDRIGTLDATGAYWSPANKGQNGASGVANIAADDDLERTVAPSAVVPVVSMYRAMDADGAIDAMMGQMAASWMKSPGPKSANFHPTALGIRHGTPGAATDSTVTPADTAAEAKAKADAEAAAAKAAADKIANTGTIPEAGHIYISEIMFAGGGTFPQWIEIANGSATEEVNLSGWTLTIDNAAADADVDVSSVKFTIPNGTMIGMARQTSKPSTVLVVTEAGRHDLGNGDGQIINLQMTNEVELINAGITQRKYSLLSDMAFLITLAPPAPAASKAPAGETAAAKAQRMAMEKKDAAMRKEATDMAGNLGADGAAAWALEMSEDGRSSIIRKHINVSIGPSEPEDGTMAENWTLASETGFATAQHRLGTQSYYGAPSDEGTPGYRAGGALPVELSHFRPVRDKATGQVTITWSTQSELNNAGFFIKRSNQRDGEFQVINATMVPGAGTTSEKQFYTYTDTTAQPNVVYYYQIEDVSLDGNRQTLTRGIRLKGHVGAAGKATTLWGELKASHE